MWKNLYGQEKVCWIESEKRCAQNKANRDETNNVKANVVHYQIFSLRQTTLEDI